MGRLKGDNRIKVQGKLPQIHGLTSRNRDRPEVYSLTWMLGKKKGHAVMGNKTVGEFRSV